jgi:ribosomal protein S18 acetylase RimI-like enzyme
MHTEDLTFTPGYTPGICGHIVGLHGAYYARHHGFGAPFEARVAAGLADLLPRLSRPGNLLLHATRAGQFCGSIAIDSEDQTDGAAHLRYFIVADGHRGHGIGRQLLQQALAFCDAREAPCTRLWTFRGLDAARRLYEQAGFRLVSERPGTQWGTEVFEQVFERDRPPSPGRDLPEVAP